MLEAALFRFADSSMMRAVAPTSIFSICAFNGAKAKLDSALGVALPEQPFFVTKNNVQYIWSGPALWLVIGADLAGFAIVEPFAAITDQTDGRAVFEVFGGKAKAALAKLLPIDLHDDSFPVGATALTLAEHINVHIWRVAEDRFCLACFRSFATALYDALTLSCREFES